MLEILLKMLEELENDVSFELFYNKNEVPMLYITVEDFEGFDNDWCEVMREYDTEAVHKVVVWLEEHCISKEDCYFIYYQFEDFEVRFDYASSDI